MCMQYIYMYWQLIPMKVLWGKAFLLFSFFQIKKLKQSEFKQLVHSYTTSWSEGELGFEPRDTAWMDSQLFLPLEQTAGTGGLNLDAHPTITSDLEVGT